MKRFTITHLMLLVTWCAIATFLLSRYFATAPYQGAVSDINGNTFYTYGLDEDTVTNIEAEAVKLSPPWHPADSNPPVSARAALSLAERFRQKRLRDTDNWKWGLESLTLYPLDEKNNKWCWCVLFEAHPAHGGLGGMPPQFSAFVLMNGEIVMPESEATENLNEWGLVEKQNAQPQEKRKGSQ